MENIFLQLAVVLALASLLGYLIHLLKLPLVVAYLLAGVVLSIGVSVNPHNLGIFSFLPDIGIAFVLFLIGMELDLREIRSLGLPIIAASIGQILITSLAGFAIAGLWGFNQTQSLYLGLGLSFSSTIVVIKLLLEKRDLSSLYGKLAVGILLVEDLMAVVVLMSISVSSSILHIGLQQSWPLVAVVAKAIGLFLLTFVLARWVLERVFDAVAKNVEILFLTAITWCFVFTSLAIAIGFSVVIGAFLAGVALASSPYHLQIQGKIKPLRDFFVTLFFVYLGSQIRVSDLLITWPLILALTGYALIVKPTIFLLILGNFGFRKHTLFQTALHLSQISEFSLVILLTAVSANIVEPVVLSTFAAVAVLSIILSAVLIARAKQLYLLLSPMISFFEHTSRVHHLEKKVADGLSDHVVVIGAHRVGGPIVRFLSREKIPLMVMDFNPHIVEQLRQEGTRVIYGDVGDPDVLDNLDLEKAKLIISTATDLTDNEILLEECHRRKVSAKVVARAAEKEDADKLKKLGADYVILPEQVSGDYLTTQLKNHWPNIKFAGLS